MLGTHQRRELLVDDLDHLLGRGKALQHLLPDGPLAHPSEELPDDFEVDVRFEEGKAHLPQGRLDILFAELAPPSQLLKDRLQPLREAFKHSSHPRALRFDAGRLNLDERGPSAREPLDHVAHRFHWAQRFHRGVDLRHRLSEGRLPALKALDELELAFKLLERLRRTFEDVVNSLPAYPVLGRDLAQREVVVVIQLEKLLLPLGEELTVEVEEQAHPHGLLDHPRTTPPYDALAC